MRRKLILTVGCFLIACLALATSVTGFFRAAHEIAQAGQTTMVICGQNGPGTVTLDRNGTPIGSTNSGCGHCGECTNLPAFDLPAFAAIARGAVEGQSVALVAPATVVILRLDVKLPRGPPSKAII